MDPKLSILMPALASRVSTMRPLIEAQIDGVQDVEFLIDVDNGEVTSGAKRQRLLERARGLYVAFVDDDDEVTTDYVAEILGHCEHVDVVTFQLELRRGGRVSERWSFGLQRDDRRRGRMAANHLCAWRREIASRVAWCPRATYADDQLWYKPLIAAGLAKSERHIPRVLYRYRFDPQTTANHKIDRIEATKAYVGAGLRVFWLGDQVVIEEPGEPAERRVVVRDAQNRELCVKLSDLRLITTVTAD